MALSHTRLRSVPVWFLLLVTCAPQALADDKPKSPYDDAPFSAASSQWEGYSEFVAQAIERLGADRVKIVARLDYSELRPSDAIVIVHPTHSLDDQSLSGFLSDGGRVALLDDYGTGSGFLRKFGVVLVDAPTRPLATLRNNPDLPIAVPSVQIVAGTERGRHPIAADIEQIMTNHPRVIQHPDLTPVFEIPDEQGRSHPLSVTGVIAQKGRLFVMSDPSVFINLMIRYPDNRKLAQGLFDYLTQARSTETSGSSSPPSRLYIVANGFDEVGSYGGQHSFFDQLKDVFDDAKDSLASVADDGLPPGLSLAIAAAALLWLLSSQIKQQLRVPRLLVPSFSRLPALAGQVGLQARLTVLSSKDTSPILALMELDSALRETVERRLGFGGNLTPRQLGEELKNQGVSSTVTDEVELTLMELRRFGQSLSNGKPARATEKDLRRLHHKAMQLIATLDQRGDNL